jgi:superfamily II DNA or RNA helicase|tara:strand:+ start:228 stop:1322 length:1095 start_codon:yes stop_codon:yes gene_type:complete
MTREEVQKKALDIAIKNKRVGLGISMGVGKTRIAIQHLQHYYNSLIEVLVVIPKHSVTQSWIDELNKLNLQDLVKHITFTTYLSINKHNPNEYDIVYLDECHSLLPNHEPFLSNFNGKILGLTGTPPEGFDKSMMVKKYCPIKYNFTVDEATDARILNNYNIIVHELLLSQTPSLKKMKKDGGHWYTTELKDYEYVSKRLSNAVTPEQRQFAAIFRMRALMDYTTKELYAKKLEKSMDTKCLIFANTQKQADKICKHSYHSGNKKSDENLELFSDGRIDRLSCVLQLSEGISIPDLKQGIIMHAYGNERKSSQRIGRLLRLNPTETAVCHILCYKGTQDEVWVGRALKDFDKSKIKYYNPLKTK